MLSIAVLSLSAFGQNLVQDRIVQAIENDKVTAMPGTVHPQAQARYDQGLLDGGQKLPGMRIDFQRTAAQQSALATLLKAQQDPSSPSYHQWLSAEEFGARFGMSQADLGKVTAWLQSRGFTVDKVADSQNSIRFSGTVAQADAAFRTQIHKYTVNGRSHFANSTAISLPATLASTVIRVGGLDNFGPRPDLVRQRGRQTAVNPNFTSGSNYPDAGSHYLAPTDFAVIYDLNPLYTAGFNGSGQTIGIMAQTDIVMADITDFRTNAALPAYGATGGPTFTSYLIPGATDPGVQDLSGDVNEADLDIEWSGGVAPNANIMFVISSEDSIFDALQYAIGNKINGLQLPILSISYGGCEAAQSTAGVDSLEASFEQANAQGQTVVSSAGDSGAAACDDTADNITEATQGLAVNYPASSAYVSGLGGSEFTGDGTAADPSLGSDEYWLGTGATDLLTSAKSYIPEMAWNDTAFDIANGGGLSAGGGGKSILFTKPTWQTGVPGIPSDSARDVPDLSLNASADHDGFLVCTQIILASDDNPDPTSADFSSSCGNGFRISDPSYVGPPEDDDNGFPTIYGGTSAAAPSFAGILALIEQKLGTPLGNVNPALYTLASNSATYASAFHDITVGNNDVPCASGSPDCPTSGTLEFGYSAAVGYDQATGLGSVDGNELATAFASVATKGGTTTTLAVSPTVPLVGATITLSAKIAPNNGSTTAPTGTVIFTVDGTALPAVTVTSAVATTTTSFSTGGTHTVVAAYSGDSNYFASTTTSTITVTTSSTAAPTTTTLSTGGQTSVALNQGSITLTATVTSTTAGTIAGQVEFTIGTVALAPVTVTSGASGSASASTTVAATAANGFTAGTVSITAAYGGDSSYAGSTSAAAPITVTNPALTMTVANMTISGSGAGNTGTSAISVTSTGGYAGTVNLTATATSLSANYAITPSSLAIASGATGTASISVQTIASSIEKSVGGNLRHSSTPTSNNHVIAGAAAAFGFIFLLGIPGFRKKRWPMLTVILLLGALSAGLGCGGGGGGSGGSPAGTYTVTVTATDSVTAAITTSTNFTVTIQ